MNIDALFDPERTLPAGRLHGVIHLTEREANWYGGRFMTLCGIEIRRADLLIMLQRPADISCADCKRVEGFQTGSKTD